MRLCNSAEGTKTHITHPATGRTVCGVPVLDLSNIFFDYTRYYNLTFHCKKCFSWGIPHAENQDRRDQKLINNFHQSGQEAPQ